MSGILLPGQDKKPSSEGKIELPKGYSTARKGGAPEQPAQSPPESIPPTPQETEKPAAGQRAEDRHGQELLFPPRGAQIRCPACGTPYVAPVFTIIDLGANPELRAPLLGGQVNVASCPSCGAGGPLGAPLMVHDPEHQFLGVFVPAESGKDDLERQQVIGELIQTLMRKMPTEARKGYMLQPMQYVDRQRFMEKMWEFEGVTPDMLRKQRDQSGLLQRLMGLVDDDKALELALERSKQLVDRDFFNLLDQLVVMVRSQGQQDESQALLRLRQKLLDTTEAGAVVKQQQEKIRSILAKITPKTTREDLLQIVLDAWNAEDGQQIVGTLAVAASGLMDYQFLMLLSERIGATAEPEQQKQLEDLRKFLLDVQEQVVARQRQSQESVAQQAQELIQEVLQSNDVAATLRENADYIDETFLSILAANIQSAERKNATAAARRMRQVYEAALEIVQENMPEDMRLLNDLLSAPDEAAMRRLLRENRELLSKEFMDALRPLETEMRENKRTDIADRLRSLRAQIALML